MNHSTIEMRKLTDLKIKNPYLRMGTDVSDLEKSIRTVGLIAPLVITTDDELLAGARRYQALLNLGHTEAPVIIIDQGELERELISIDENLVRKDLTKMEMEGHLRRAKELHQALHPEDFLEPAPVEEASTEESENKVTRAKIERLPGENFLKKVSEKTGLSTKQIYEAIKRDESAAPEVKEARARGELSLSQTNEIVKLAKEDQSKAIAALKSRPVREIKKIVKAAKARGIDHALKEMPEEPHAREFRELEAGLTKLCRLLKRYQLEELDFSLMPEKTRTLFKDFTAIVSELELEDAPASYRHEESFASLS